MPRRTCLIVMEGFQSFSSFRMERQTFPDGKMFGWKKSFSNLHPCMSHNSVAAFRGPSRAMEAATKATPGTRLQRKLA